MRHHTAEKMSVALLGLGVGAALIGVLRQQRLTSDQGSVRQVGTVKPGTALVTGASSGIGAAFARLLAARGYHLILVARRESRLSALAHELQQRYDITAEVLAADLACSDGIESVEKRIATVNDLVLLVNAAGFGLLGLFAESDLDKHLDMLSVHVPATVRLALAALPGMIARKHGGIINVSSIGAFLHGPQNVIYCATKAYVNTFSLALQDELYETGVHVQALCPGFTRTEFHDSPEYARSAIKSRLPGAWWMNADDVARASLAVLWQGPVICVPGFKNRLFVAFAQSAVLDVLLRLLLTWYARSLRQKVISTTKSQTEYLPGKIRPPQTAADG